MHLPIIIPAILALGLIEVGSWWWMHPAPSGLGQPILAYRPEIEDRRSKIEDEIPSSTDHRSPITDHSTPNQKSKTNNQHSEIPPSYSTNLQSPIPNLSSPSPNQKSKTNNQHSEIPPSSPPNQQSKIPPSSTTTTLLPELYRQAAPMLRCTSGRVFHIALDEDNRASLHAAWFEWDDTDAGSVLEAFRHPPEACMGAIGMKLVSREKPIHYTVEMDRRPVRQSLGDDGAGPLVANGANSQRDAEAKSQESANATAQSPSSTDHRSRITDHSSSSNLHLIFDHTIFREPGASNNPLLPAPPVHAFRAVWVAGMPGADARQGIAGQPLDNLRTIRLRAALTRHRPTHARVIQAAVRGHHTTEDAWNAFEQTVLQNLTFSASGASLVRGQ